MATKRKREVFSAGCPGCEGTCNIINRHICSSCEVNIHDMKNPEIANSAKNLGIFSVPAVVIDSKNVEQCTYCRPDEAMLWTAGRDRALSH